jgi:transcriptional regulator with XRE-family HTH domain
MNDVDSSAAQSGNIARGRLLLLAEQWDGLVSRARSLEWGNAGLMDLAMSCGLEWYPGRGNEPLAWFLKHDGRQLVTLPGFGQKKLTKLCEILCKALEIRTGASPSVIPIEKPEPGEVLLEWDIPEEFPCRLCLLPVRVLSYCETQGIMFLAQLLDEWRRLGFEGFKKLRNLGTKSVRQIEVLVHALENRDAGTASLFLPLGPSGRGLSLSAALALVARLPNPAERAMLHRRLINRMTLEESAEDAGVTRERVRQIEAGFLEEIQARLDYFAAERDDLLHAWINGQNWFELLLPMDDAELVTAAIESIFEETPQACARDLGREAKWDAWCEEMRTHPDLWFGGVILDDFFAERVPADQTEEFCECIASCRDLRLDHGSGRVFPTKTGLYNSVLAMLAREDDPVPLTWLVELLVQTGYHPEVTSQTLKRHKSNWLTRADFPGEKIIWTE